MTSGFSKATFDFLTELRANNDRSWFQANKKRYEDDLLEPALAYVSAMGPLLEDISPHYLAEAKKSGGSLLRIYRDVRFSKDKSPYKTNMGISFKHMDGKKFDAPAFYVHADPEEVFLGVGLWKPTSKSLALIREAIVDDPESWVAARDDAAFRASWELGDGNPLKRPPRGYDADHPLIDDLKRRSFTASIKGKPDELYSSDVVARSAERFAAASPFMGWLCDAIGAPY